MRLASQKSAAAMVRCPWTAQRPPQVKRSALARVIARHALRSLHATGTGGMKQQTHAWPKGLPQAQEPTSSTFKDMELGRLPVSPRPHLKPAFTCMCVPAGEGTDTWPLARPALPELSR